MYAIIGLGNPDKKYEKTRHNVGFDVIDELAGQMGIDVKTKRHKALCGVGHIGSEKVILVKPQTYMNLSGESVRMALDYYKEPPENLIVIYDDIDIPTGSIRIRKKGSAGTHNGMRNILYQIQSEDFPRIRVGIGSGKKDDLISYVIGGVTKGEKELLEDSLTRAADAAACIVEKGIEKAMNEYNIRPKKAHRPGASGEEKQDAAGEKKND